jgi:histidinol-phosphate aminotransferase
MTEINQGVVVTVPFLEPFQYNLEGILNAITSKTKMIIICNPNNPTGGYVGIDAIEEFIKKVPDNVVILFDEAYIEFATAEDCKSAYPFIEKYPQKPILVMRTFSKYYAMAGVRCGYVLTSEELAAGINKVPGSWIPGAAQAEAVAALTDEEYYSECKEKIIAGKEYIAEELEKLGCTVYPSQSNFIMYDPHCDIEELRSYIIDKGILTTMALGLGRVSVGTPQQNELYITYMKEYFDSRK